MARLAGRCGAGENTVRRFAAGISTTAPPARSSTRRRISMSSDEMDVERDRARYEADRRKDILLSGHAGHRRRAQGSPARRVAVSGRHRCSDSRETRLPDRHRAVCARGERADAAVSRAVSLRARRRSASRLPARPAASPVSSRWPMRSSRPRGAACRLGCFRESEVPVALVFMDLRERWIGLGPVDLAAVVTCRLE